MKLHRAWPEIIALWLVAIGFIFALTAIESYFTLILMSFLWGLIFGRLWYRFKRTNKVALVIIIAGFMLGFIIACLTAGYDASFSIVLTSIAFIFGVVLSYYVHNSKVLRSTEY